ncbi:hypothetical protein E2562_023032 [Oryza meyeriana var. granulata]|uniref:Uncharacterized protein n=1 Tax=Oryza meyeriana var. granulata TaxID=110450 RepID=A0A6G1EYH9_9ORYZ|nr:hypothetical protein E2562_023032 [Oryza meyeriana var. granulata]
MEAGPRGGGIRGVAAGRCVRDLSRHGTRGGRARRACDAAWYRAVRDGDAAATAGSVCRRSSSRRSGSRSCEAGAARAKSLWPGALGQLG